MTANEIIRASIVAHPVEFRAALIKQAEMHDDYARTVSNPRARQGAMAQFHACLSAYDTIGLVPRLIGGYDEAASMICAKCGTMVIALNVAGKLQGLPRATLTAAAVAWDSANA